MVVLPKEIRRILDANCSLKSFINGNYTIPSKLDYSSPVSSTGTVSLNCILILKPSALAWVIAGSN